MRIAEMTDAEVEALVKTDLENGIDFFDHADIYGRGACEARFGALLRPGAFAPRQDHRSDKMRHCARRGIRFQPRTISWTAWTAA